MLLSEDQTMIRDMARQFASERLAPFAACSGLIIGLQNHVTLAVGSAMRGTGGPVETDAGCLHGCCHVQWSGVGAYH